MARRFPPPWSVERIPGGWRVIDANATKLVYVYAADPRSQASKSTGLNEEQALRVAAAITALPSYLLGGRSAPDTGQRAPFRVDERDGWFAVMDADDYSVASVYFEDQRAGDITWDEARRIAANIAKLPELQPSREGEI